MKQRLFIALALALASAPCANAEWQLASVGGDEGTPFALRCPVATNLVGLDIYSRDDIDAVGVVCASAYSPTEMGTVVTGDAPMGGAVKGANHSRLLCAGATPVVTGAYIKAEIDATAGVNNVHVYCGVAGNHEVGELMDRFDGPVYKTSGIFPGFSGIAEATAHCPRNLVAIGVHGSSSGWIHSLGLICGEPGITVRKVGRIKPLDPVGKTAATKSPGFGATDFCESYAADAVTAAIANRRRACGGDGGRWTTDFNRHFDWCISLNGDKAQAEAETTARAAALAACAN